MGENLYPASINLRRGYFPYSSEWGVASPFYKDRLLWLCGEGYKCDTRVLLWPAIAGDRPERVKVNALLQANGRCDATKEREESSRSQVNIHFYHGDEIKWPKNYKGATTDQNVYFYPVY